MNEHGQRILDEIFEHRGIRRKKHEVLADIHPVFLDGFNQCFMSASSEDSAIPTRYRELIFMVADILMGADAKGVRGHSAKAIAAGATPEEVVNAVEIAALVSTGPAMEAMAFVFEDQSAG